MFFDIKAFNASCFELTLISFSKDLIVENNVSNIIS